LSSTTTTTAAETKSSPILDRKIEETCIGLQTSYSKKLQSICENNAETIVGYISAMKGEVTSKIIREVIHDVKTAKQNKGRSQLGGIIEVKGRTKRMGKKRT
jgi:predicted S18 family serine protease